ncbi:MAG: CHAP domain-containing protein [Bacteroidales bacterium]|nr:CHAP domain-containing protein [Bacteroidales bacterium]
MSFIVVFIIIIILIITNKKNQIVKRAKKYIGQEETTANKAFKNAMFEKEMREIQWYSGAEWCAFFARKIWLDVLKGKRKETAEKLLSGSSQQTYMNFANDKSGLFKVDMIPRKGSIIVWQSQKDKTRGHVGIVKSVFGDKFYTIEGNTNVNGSPGIVARKKYSIKDELNKQTATGLKLRGFISPKKAIFKKSLKGLNGNINDRIINFVERSQRDKQYNGRILLSYVNDNLSKKIKAVTGYELKGDDIYFYANDVRHIFKSHPETRKEDFTLLPDILERPNLVIRSYDKYGKERIRIIKKYDSEHILILEINLFADYLRIITMFTN